MVGLRGDRHQAADSEAGLGGDRTDNLGQLQRIDPALGLGGGELYLHQDREPGGFGAAVYRLGQAERIDRFDDIEIARSVARLVALQSPDQVPPGLSVKSPDLGHPLLDTVLPEPLQPRPQTGLDVGVAECLGDRDELYVLARTAGRRAGGLDLLFDLFEIAGYRAGNPFDLGGVA